MESTDPEACVLCGEPAAGAPRIFIRQEHALDAPIAHYLALCPEHGTELGAGERSPQQIIYAWATRAHGDLYRNERLVLRPELCCLACNAPLPAGSVHDVGCPACGAMNGVGSALGHPVAVRLHAPAPASTSARPRRNKR